MNFALFIPAIVVILFGIFFSMKKSKQMSAQYADMKDLSVEHPEVARVYIYTKTGIKDEAIHVHTINGDTFIDYDNLDIYKVRQGEKWQMIFTEQNKNNYVGFYALPGDHTMNISYVNSRPGVIYNSVSEYTDRVDFDFKVEPNKKYLLAFDNDINKFTFEESSDL